MIIYVNKGDTAYDAANDRTIEIVGAHFEEWRVVIHEDITDDDCNVTGERTTDTIFTRQEVDKLFGRGNRVMLRGEARKYAIRDREAGNEIETFDTLEEAEAELEAYEAIDKAAGIFEEDFYEIVDCSEL